MRTVKTVFLNDHTKLSLISDDSDNSKSLEIIVSGRCGFLSTINISNVDNDDLVNISNALLELKKENKE